MKEQITSGETYEFGSKIMTYSFVLAAALNLISPYKPDYSNFNKLNLSYASSATKQESNKKNNMSDIAVFAEEPQVLLKRGRKLEDITENPEEI